MILHRTVFRQHGFSLIELMVALVIGLILIGGAISVFLSNQQTYRTTQDLDNAQEAFRFASQTIMRVARQASDFESSSSDSVLRFEMSGESSGGVRDCLGEEVTNEDANNPPWIIEFELVGNDLNCNVTRNDGSQSETLVSNLEEDSLAIRYSVSNDYWKQRTTNDSGGLLTNSSWSTTPEVESPSFTMRFQMENSGLTTTFTATLRSKTFN